jgi:hypothetical protein
MRTSLSPAAAPQRDHQRPIVNGNQPLKEALELSTVFEHGGD